MCLKIDLAKYDHEKAVNLSGGVISKSLDSIASNSRVLADVVEQVKTKQHVFWVTEGEWSMHQLLMALLGLTGAADVAISSYALGELQARLLSTLKSDGTIKTLRCVLDNRTDTRTAGSLQIIKSIADEYALVATHAKVTLIYTSAWQITVIGSANYTSNARFETGIITSCPAAYSINENWITKALADGME